MMNTHETREDIQLLRQAALEIQADGKDLVRVAGIIQRIKNWWKARWDSDFRERSEQVQQAYSEMKVPLGTLIDQLKQFENAVQSHSADDAARIVNDIQGSLTNVVRDMKDLKTKLKAVDVVIPTSYVDEEGKEISGRNLGYVTKGYKKNRALIEELWELLPEQFRNEIPIGKRINQPISNFGWYHNYDPHDVVFKPDVQRMTKDILFKGLADYFDAETIATFDSGYAEFLDNLKVAILHHSILVQVNFPNVSGKISQRRSNEMEVEVIPGEVQYPVTMPDGSKVHVYINVGKVLFHDLGTSVNAAKQISVFLVRHLTLSTESQRLLHQAKKERAKAEEIASTINPEEKEEDIETKTSSDGRITRIVKRAILRERLPLTNAVVKVDGQTFHHKARFAKVLSSALRQEIDAECSVRHQGDDVEVQVAVYGSKFTTLPAIYGISMYIADRFLHATKVGVDVDVVPGLSSFGLMESDVLDSSFRKVAFDSWR